MQVTKFLWSPLFWGRDNFSGEDNNYLTNVVVQSLVSDSVWPHGLKHTRLPCPSLSPWVHSNSCPLSQWCHPTISSSVTPFSSALSLSQHQGLFQWAVSSHQVAKVLELQFQNLSYQWIFRIDLFRIDWFDFLAVQETLKTTSNYFSGETLPESKLVLTHMKAETERAKKLDQGRW